MQIGEIAQRVAEDKRRLPHIPGHASYRVDMPAGRVVIVGDAGNPRLHATS